jgi:thymidylate synthase, flavin-dependent
MIEDGVAPEQARFILPQGMETTWVWTGSLLAYSRFYQLRSSPEAQKEVQELALLVSDVIKPLFPISWSALNE